MKKNFLCICLFLCASQICFGQFTAGQKVLGGTVSLGFNNSKDTLATGYNYQNYSFSISPSFGKFKDDKTLVEYNLLFGFGGYKSNNINDTTNNKTFNAGAGYTFTKLYPLVSKVYFTLGYGADLSYTHYSYKNSGSQIPNQQADYGSFSVGITPGILIPVRNNKMLLRTGFSNLASAGFSLSKTTRNYVDGTKSSYTGGSANLSFGSSGFFNGLYVGISWLLK